MKSVVSEQRRAPSARAVGRPCDPDRSSLDGGVAGRQAGRSRWLNEPGIGGG
jgi:hypothetical protein